MVALSTVEDKEEREIVSKTVKIGPDRLTRFERARIVGARALQLSLGAPILVKLPKSVDKRDTLQVAKYEIEKKVVPLVVVRNFPDGRREVVGLN